MQKVGSLFFAMRSESFFGIFCLHIPVAQPGREAVGLKAPHSLNQIT